VGDENFHSVEGRVKWHCLYLRGGVFIPVSSGSTIIKIEHEMRELYRK